MSGMISARTQNPDGISVALIPAIHQAAEFRASKPSSGRIHEWQEYRGGTPAGSLFATGLQGRG
jgi:hypothetical protein